MLIVTVNEKTTIDRALKIMKSKVAKTKIMKELRERQEYVKPSIRRRDEIKKAIHIQKLKEKEENAN
jgi:small subunit ribosomal protein S21